MPKRKEETNDRGWTRKQLRGRSDRRAVKGHYRLVNKEDELLRKSVPLRGLALQSLGHAGMTSDTLSRRGRAAPPPPSTHRSAPPRLCTTRPAVGAPVYLHVAPSNPLHPRGTAATRIQRALPGQVRGGGVTDSDATTLDWCHWWGFGHAAPSCRKTASEPRGVTSTSPCRLRGRHPRHLLDLTPQPPRTQAEIPNGVEPGVSHHQPLHAHQLLGAVYPRTKHAPFPSHIPPVS